MRMNLRAASLLAVFPLLLPALPVAASTPNTTWSATLRVQPELVYANGRAAEARGEDGLHLSDGWSQGRPNSQNFGALFLDAAQRLGGDTRLIARYSLNHNMDGLPDKRLREREVFVGLDGRWGQLRAGRLETPYMLSTVAWDPLNASFLQARGNLGRAPGPLGHGGYVNDAVDYTGKLGAATLRVFHARNDAPGAAPSVPGSDDTWGASLNLPIGAWELAFVHVDAGDRGRGRRDASKLGARWSQGALSVHGQYEWRGRGLENGDFLMLGASWRQGPRNWVLNAGRFADDTAARDDGHYLALGLQQRINPRLSLHAGLRRSERERAGGETLLGLGLRIVLDAKGQR